MEYGNNMASQNTRTSRSFSTYLAQASSLDVPSTDFHASLCESESQDRNKQILFVARTHHLAFPVKSSIPGLETFTSPTVAAHDLGSARDGYIATVWHYVPCL